MGNENNENQVMADNVSNPRIFDKEYANAQDQDAPHLMMLKEFEEHLTSEDSAKIKKALEESANGEITVEDNDGCVFKIKDNKVREITASENSETAKGKFHFFKKDDKIKLDYSYREKNDHGFQKKSIKYKENEDSSKYKHKEVELTKSSGSVERKTASTKIRTDEDSKVVTQKRTKSGFSNSLLVFNDYHIEQRTETQKYEKDGNGDWKKVGHIRSVRTANVGTSGVAGSYEKTNITDKRTVDENGNRLEVTRENTVGVGLNLTSPNISVKHDAKTTYSANGEKFYEEYNKEKVDVGLKIGADIEKSEIDHTTNSSYKQKISAGVTVKGVPQGGFNVSTELKTPDLHKKSNVGLEVTNKTIRGENKTVITQKIKDQTGKEKTVTAKKGGGFYFDYDNPVEYLGNVAIRTVLSKQPKAADLKATMKAQTQKNNTNGTPQSNTEENASMVKPNLKETMKTQAQERSQETNTSKNSAQNTVAENATTPQTQSATNEKSTENTGISNSQSKQINNQSVLYAQMQRLRGR